MGSAGPCPHGHRPCCAGWRCCHYISESVSGVFLRGYLFLSRFLGLTQALTGSRPFALKKKIEQVGWISLKEEVDFWSTIC